MESTHRPANHVKSLVTHLLTSPWLSRLVIIHLGLLAAILLALAVARSGPLILGLMGAAVSGLLLLVRPLLGMYAIVLSLPVEDLLPAVGGATGTRILGMAVFGIWFLRRIIRQENWLPILKIPLVQISLVFLTWIFISTLWAGDRMQVFLGLATQIQLFFLLVILIDQVKTRDQLAWIVRLLVLAGSVAAATTLQQYFVAEVKRAGDGVAGGINFTASFLVCLFPMAFYLLRTRQPGFWKFLALLYISTGLTAVVVTFSRYSYLLLVLVLAVHSWQLLTNRSGRWWMVLVVGVVVAGILWLPSEEVSERVQTISPLFSNLIDAMNGQSVTEDVRAFHWRVGLTMLRTNPLLGVGYNNFGIQFLSYQFEVLGSPDIFREPRSPHSSFIGILVELGLVGLGLWFTILVITFRNFIQAGRQAIHEQTRDHYYLVQTFLFIFILQILYAWALNPHLNKIFWLILAISIVVNRLAVVPVKSDQGLKDFPMSQSRVE